MSLEILGGFSKNPPGASVIRVQWNVGGWTGCMYAGKEYREKRTASWSLIRVLLRFGSILSPDRGVDWTWSHCRQNTQARGARDPSPYTPPYDHHDEKHLSHPGDTDLSSTWWWKMVSRRSRTADKSVFAQ
ncbi:hypothetical protein ILYODFUR_039060 [Ilyodon furcidens]|uniref:Uncharacterized protein n=1 Tax=Ilyodon furcidens TaxID=33524 RepID=A0ABV0UES4_9TELE